MQKFTQVLAVVEESASGAVVLDKAVALARCFGASVELLITDPLLTSEFVSRCAAQVYDEVTVRNFQRSGAPLCRQLLSRVCDQPPDLVVKAPTNDQPLRKWTLQANDRLLANECPVPVLLAGPRPWGKPLRFAAAVNVAAPAAVRITRSLLYTAGFLTLGSHGRLDILYSERERLDERVRMERAVILAQLVREFHVGSESLQMFEGEPEERLPALLAQRQYDVLLLGSDSHREGLQLGENLTSLLAEATGGDVLLVPAGAPDSRERPGAGSSRQKVPHQAEELV